MNEMRDPVRRKKGTSRWNALYKICFEIWIP